MRFRDIVENKKNTLEEAINVCKCAGYVLTEARPRPWRGDMRTRMRDKSMLDDMGVDMAAKERRGAAVAAWREAIENETIFADEMLVNKLNMLKAKLDSCHFSWRESKDGPYKITIRIKDVFDYAKPTEDTEKLWKKIKAELKQMLGSNGVLAHGVKVVPGGYVVCAWSLHNFEPYKNDEPFTREDVINDIKTGIESIVMVCDKWNYEAEKESKREFSSMEESYINEDADDWSIEELIVAVVDNEGIPGHIVEAVIDERLNLENMSFDDAYDQVTFELEHLSDEELADYGL